MALAITIISVLALTACGGSAGSNESADSGSAETSLADTGGGRAAEGTAAEKQAAEPGQDTKQAPAVAKQAIISTGAIATEVKDVAKARTRVQHVTDKHSGQVAEQETGTDEDGRPGHARMVLRIPSASFAEAMAELEKLGALVDSSTTATDVTTEVVDTDVRVKNARASIERIRTLLARAERIGDVISIESELASREAELNSLLAQQAHLADQTSLSTITVSISRDGTTPADGSDSGFLPGLSAGWGALRAAGTWLATGAGVVIPWVPVIALVGVPLWLLARRRRQLPTPAPAAAGAAGTAEGADA
ncbi:MAG: DUF4349 domain-containing protein [Nocardioides sp.]|uniref:DUF4349 domain-containing protein n=1 Tax=Nocardioides sp. TaxID=35761 RepID=UPI003D6BFFE8